jgi:hypothetical protein
VLLYLSHDETVRSLNVPGRLNCGKRLWEDGVDDDALDFHDPTDVALSHDASFAS